MGIYHRVILVENTNWNYVGFDRSEVLRVVQKYVYAELELDMSYWMVFDINKNHAMDLYHLISTKYCSSIYQSCDFHSYDDLYRVSNLDIIEYVNDIKPDDSRFQLFDECLICHKLTWLCQCYVQYKVRRAIV